MVADPLRGKTAGNEVTITVPNEELMRGPASARIKVIDYDGSLNVYHRRHEDPRMLPRTHGWALCMRGLAETGIATTAGVAHRTVRG